MEMEIGRVFDQIVCFSVPGFRGLSKIGLADGGGRGDSSRMKVFRQ